MASQLATNDRAQASPRFLTYGQIFNSGDPRKATVIAMLRLLMVLGKPPDIPRAEAFSEALSDLAAADLIRAFERAEVECEIFPSISKLREFALGSERHLQQDIQAEWTSLHAYIKRWGPRIAKSMRPVAGADGYDTMQEVQDSPIFSDRQEHILAHLGGSVIGGLERIVQTNPEHKGLLRQDFERAFKSFVPQQE